MSDMHDFDLRCFPPAQGRTHEICGAGVYTFAFSLAARVRGQCIWLREKRDATQINPNGFAEFFPPSHLTIGTTKDHKQTLAVAEEALRSGAVSLVVLNINKPLGLTEGRRLQLAARDGKSTGLVIIPEDMGSNAAETRWHCAPVFDLKDSTLQKWKLIKNKSGTLGVWYVRWNPTSRRIIVVSPSGK